MGSTNKNPDGVDTNLATREQLQSYTRAEADLAQLRVPVLLYAGSPHGRLYIAAQDGTGKSLHKDAPTHPPAEHRHPSRRRPPWAFALATSIALTGCQSAMTDPADTPALSTHASPASGGATSDGVVATWPLRFTGHKFDASCYSTYGCKVRYGNYRRIDSDDELKLSSASIGDKYPGNLSAGWGPVRNFPPPAVVTWRSRDGTPLHAEVDMAEIFKDQLILHNLRREEVGLNVSDVEPQIILEVNDRTINVYMRAHVSTKGLQIPGNRYSDFRNDLVKAHSRTY